MFAIVSCLLPLNVNSITEISGNHLIADANATQTISVNGLKPTEQSSRDIIFLKRIFFTNKAVGGLLHRCEALPMGEPFVMGLFVLGPSIPGMAVSFWSTSTCVTIGITLLSITDVLKLQQDTVFSDGELKA